MSSPPSDRARLLGFLRFRVPAHGRLFFFTLGGIVFSGFLLMLVTGLLLAQVYHPAPELAYGSLTAIQQSGWARFTRALHYWTAQGIIVALLLHLSRVFITGAYKSPRRATWWCGVALLAVMLMGSYFSGTVLKWDEEGFDALAHYREAAEGLGSAGALLVESLPGGPSLNFRIYVAHIAGFPLLLISLIILHFYLIHVLNLSPTPKDAWADQLDIPMESMTETLGEHLKSIALFSAIYYGWLAVLAFFVGAPLGGPPVSEHSPLKPPWPFLWMYGFENRWGIIATVYASTALFGILAGIPLLDRKQDRRFRARKPILALGTGLAATLLGLTLHGYITPAQTHTHHHAAPYPADEQTPLPPSRAMGDVGDAAHHADSDHSEPEDHHPH